MIVQIRMLLDNVDIAESLIRCPDYLLAVDVHDVLHSTVLSWMLIKYSHDELRTNHHDERTLDY